MIVDVVVYWTQTVLVSGRWRRPLGSFADHRGPDDQSPGDILGPLCQAGSVLQGWTAGRASGLVHCQRVTDHLQERRCESHQTTNNPLRWNPRATYLVAVLLILNELSHRVYMKLGKLIDSAKYVDGLPTSLTFSYKLY